MSTQHERVIHLGSSPTVFQSELEAIYQAASYLLSQTTINRDIHIFSDSLSSIQSLTRLYSNSQLVLSTIQALNTLGTSNSVQLAWVPGHAGITGNEHADELARKGSSTKPYGPDPFIKFSISHYKSALLNRMLLKHISQYDKLTYSTKGKIPIKNLLLYNKYRLPTSHKENLRWLTNVLTGHSHLNYFINKINPQQDPSCNICSHSTETSEHFLAQCPGYSWLRYTHLHTFYSTMDNITKLNKPSAIIKYIRDTRRFNTPQVLED